MYCKNCGHNIDENATFCSNCGQKQEKPELKVNLNNEFGARYCANCGTKLEAGMEICLSCGYSTKAPRATETQQQTQAPVSSKSKMAAGLLALFLGGIGVHNFYLGYTGKGIAQILLSCTGISAIWAFVEAIMIFCGKIPDADGKPLGD